MSKSFSNGFFCDQLPFGVPLYFSSAMTGKFIHPLRGVARSQAKLCFHDGGKGEKRISLVAEDAGGGAFYLKSGAPDHPAELYVHPLGGQANRNSRTQDPTESR